MEEKLEKIAFKRDGIEAMRYEDQYISRFGSHFSIKFDPEMRTGGVMPVGLGPNNAFAPLYLGFDIEEESVTSRWSLPVNYSWPFNKEEKVIRDFDIVRTMNRAKLISREDHSGLEVSFEFVSPFYPRDREISTAPFFYIRALLKNTSQEPLKGRVYIGLEDLKEKIRDDRGNIILSVPFAAAFRGPEMKPGRLLNYDLAVALTSGEAQAYRFDNISAYWDTHAVRYDLKPGEEFEKEFIFACYLTDESIVKYHGEDCDFYYKDHFFNVEEVIDFARENRQEILRKTDLFDSLFLNSSLPEEIRNFIAWNFHIYLGATWLLKHPLGRTFYTCYEGGTGYFSTIDVEYNLAPFYALFWPQLIADQLDIWAETYEKGNSERPFAFGTEHRIMEHDVGGGFEIDEQIYILGPMPVEENSNFILLNYLYYSYTGSLEYFEKHRQLCLDLADYIIDSDVNGNGLPDVGTNNTLDCFEDLYKDIEDQVFLGIKAGTALLVLARMLKDCDLQEESDRYSLRAREIFTTIDEKGWKEDHYILTLSDRKPEGWDGKSPLTTNGMAYLFFTGQELPLERSRLREDLTESAHDYTMWPSMGVWRDLVGCYFDLEPAGTYNFRPDFRGDMYPRSFNSLGMIQAYPGISISIPDGEIKISRRKDGRFPLTAFANWNSEKIPWIELKDGLAEITGQTERLTKMKVVIE